MAYGQTGSGKTYTMGSEAHTDMELNSSTGLIPRFLQDLFNQLSNTEFHLETSFLEVYGEDVHDLLDFSRAALPLREDGGGGVVCAGLTAKAVTSASQAVQILHEGTLNRTTAATLMNLTSSRSHAVFTVTLIRENVSSKLTFVDLAGSERMKKTGAEGERAREGIEINKGLLALGNVINALADDERLQHSGKKSHVPYRQSKLTRLLQDALGGNSQTLFLACVSAADTNASETLSTLHYANRARNIQNAPTRNVDPAIQQSDQLQAYASVLQSELIRQKFGNDSGSSPTGKVSDHLMNQNDVNVYLSKLQELAQQQIGISRSTFRLSAPASPPHLRVNSAGESQLAQDSNQSTFENFDPSLLDEVNPDEEMAILDQLLDLQQQDQDFGREQKKDYDALKQVEGELVEQEHLLLQLRDSLKVYHSMKAKYENLMVEVQQLELEKAQLAEQLEKSSADPTLGCSRAIKKEMEMVERNLARARDETRKHRQLYKKAEHQAQRCRSLENKIDDLKHGRAGLIKKQKEATARHHEMVESKTREIVALKRKDRNTERKLTKLECDIQMHKRNLDKRQAYCQKLSEQKKLTETHLMKLLAMRQRDLRERMTRRSHREKSAIAVECVAHEAFAAENEEIDTINFFIGRAVDETVTYAELKIQYEERVAEYSDSMRSMVSAVNSLEQASEIDRQELEHTIQVLELKVELSASALEMIRSRILRSEAADEGAEDSTATKQLIKDKCAPVLRTILVGTIDKLAKAEVSIEMQSSFACRSFLTKLLSKSQLQRKRLSKAFDLKEHVVKSLEMEVDSINKSMTALKCELVNRTAAVIGCVNPVAVIEKLHSEQAFLTTALEESQQETALLKLFAEDIAKECEAKTLTLAETKEKLTVAEMTISQKDGVQVPEDVLLKLQVIWNELGVSICTREKARSQIESSLGDTCTRTLEDAMLQKTNTMKEVSDLRQDLIGMCASLDIEPMDVAATNDSLLMQLQDLQKRFGRLKPIFSSAVARRDAIAAKATDFCYALCIPKETLCADLVSLLEAAGRSDYRADYGKFYQSIKLGDDFLSRCEKSVSELLLRKSKVLADNSKLQKNALSLVMEMNLGEADVAALAIQSVNRRLGSMPSWWNAEIADMVTRSIATEGGVIRSSRPFSQHLEVVHESLSAVAKARRELSNKLREIIERAQQTLLKTVDGELEAHEAYSTLHDALFRLPPLSKERIHSCMTEIEALTAGVDAMSQSEIEALAVVWEASNISTAKRGKFWGWIDKALQEKESEHRGPFDDVVRLSTTAGEDWVLAAVKNGSKSFRDLETRLFKLEKIHEEVEQLRSRQDSKSRIISLDSEVCILSAKLNEFEDKKCNKQRLTTKKNTSSTLLKEERFRKQMQSKFTAKVDQITALLKAWKANEGSAFDPNLLSEDVRTLLKNSDRNEFMHLRTVEYKSTAKRVADSLRARTTPLTSVAVQPSQRNSPDKERPPLKSVMAARSSKHNLSPTATDQNDAGRASKKSKTRTALEQPAVEPRKWPPGKKRLTLDPFGKVLQQALSPPVKREKENPLIDTHSN